MDQVKIFVVGVGTNWKSLFTRLAAIALMFGAAYSAMEWLGIVAMISGWTGLLR
jgi:hypothetical protein